MSAYLSIEGVGMVFPNGGEVLREIDLAIEKSEFVSIIGHSGCGKSTLLNIVAGLLKHSTGAVLLENKEIDGPGPDRAVVFQNHSLLPWLTVYENVKLAVDKVFAGKKPAKERHAWTMHNLELVHMTEAKSKRPAEISGGMKQRVGIARALAMEPKVLLLDEPFGALDALTRASMHEWLLGIQREFQRTMILITHDPDEAVYLSDRVYVASPRPMRIAGVVPIDLPVDRGRAVTLSPEFAEHKRRVLDLLHTPENGRSAAA